MCSQQATAPHFSTGYGHRCGQWGGGPLGRGPSRPRSVVLTNVVPIQTAKEIVRRNAAVNRIIRTTGRVPLWGSRGVNHFRECMPGVRPLCQYTNATDRVKSFPSCTYCITILFLPSEISIVRLLGENIIHVSSAAFLHDHRANHQGVRHPKVTCRNRRRRQ